MLWEVLGIIYQKATVYLGSHQTQATLWDAANSRMTVFATVHEQLKTAGYIQVGHCSAPGG